MRHPGVTAQQQPGAPDQAGQRVEREGRRDAGARPPGRDLGPHEAVDLHGNGAPSRDLMAAVQPVTLLSFAPPGVDVAPLDPQIRRRMFLAGRRAALRRPALRAFLNAAVETATEFDLWTESDPAPFHPDWPEAGVES